MSGELTIWGRKQLDSGPEWAETRKFADRHTPIPPEYWSVSKISPYAAVEPTLGTDIPFTQPADKGAWPKERNAYADLQVNLNQVIACCKESNRLGSDLVAQGLRKRGRTISAGRKLDPEIAKRQAIVAKARGLKHKDICKQLDSYAIPLPFRKALNVTTWSEAYKHPKLRQQIHVTLSKDRKRR